MEINFAADDATMELVNRMKQDTNRLLHLMESVLSFSRSADRKLEPVNLDVFLQRLMYRWQPRMARANVRPELILPDQIPMIRANEQSLEQVFTNLFNNALRAMADTGGTLSVRVTRSTQDGNQKMLKIEVSDTGIGIPPENLENIFTPFFTTDPQGTGLGLAITQRIILAHKGNISVDSFPGGGTVFKIEIPALPGTGSLEGLLD
jgi:signal transduction histidine kinase